MLGKKCRFLSQIKKFSNSNFHQVEWIWKYPPKSSTTIENGYIGDPWAEGPGYGFRPRVGIRNVIPSGAESAQKATRDDIPDPHEWSKPIFKPSAHGSPIPIFYSSSSETSESIAERR